MVPAQGDGIDSSTRIYLDCHQLCSVKVGSLSWMKKVIWPSDTLSVNREPSGCWSGVLTLSVKVTFDKRVLMVPMGCLPVMGSVRLVG